MKKQLGWMTLVVSLAVTGGIVADSLLGQASIMGGTFRGTGPVPPSTVVGSLPAAASSTGQIWRVTDGNAANDCTTGSGSTQVMCFSNGSAWVAMAGASSTGWVLVEQHDASASASLDLTTCFSATYDDYRIELINLLNATDNVSLLARTGAGSFDSGNNYRYAGFYMGVGDSVTGIGAAAQSSVILGNSIQTTTSWTVSGSINYYNPRSSAAFKQFTTSISSSSGADTLYRWDSSGIWLSTSAADRFQVFFSSGNITSGTIRCYGIVK